LITQKGTLENLNLQPKFSWYFYTQFSGLWVTGLNLNRVSCSVKVITGCGPKMEFLLQTPQYCLELKDPSLYYVRAFKNKEILTEIQVSI